MHHRYLHPGLVGILALLVSPPVHAGQVRVNVSNSDFTPSTITLNRGDHVVWVWSNGSHSATSGTVCGSPTGQFDSGSLTFNATLGTAFNWKTSITTTGLGYYCTPHCVTGMTGTIVVTASGTPVADFRITEVQFNTPSGQHLIEVTNFGAAAGDLGRYRFFSGSDSAIVPLQSFVVPSNGRVIVHVNASGAQSAPTDLYLPTLADLSTTGSASLYVPTTGNPNTDTRQIIDFVQWGAAGQPNEGTANTATLWTSGQFLGAVAPGHSLEFCGTASDRGASHWAEVSTPNVGTNGNCATPGIPMTWGRLKIIYR